MALTWTATLAGRMPYLRRGRASAALARPTAPAHELVDIAQALAVEHAVAIDDHGPLKRAAARQPDGAHLIDLMQEAEGAGAADVALEALGVEGDGDVLAADRAAGEVDGEAHGEAVIGRERGGLAVLADGYRLQHLDGAARRVLLDDAGAFEQEGEQRSAAVHHRHFRPVELDQRVVDLETGQRRHQMLDGRDRQAFAIVETRAQRLLDRVAPVGLDLRAGTVGAAEDDARVRRGRMQRHGHARPGMERDTATMNRRFQGFLQGDPQFVHGNPLPKMLSVVERAVNYSQCAVHTNHSLLQFITAKSFTDQ